MQRYRGNNRRGKTRDLFKKLRDTKGTFHAKMGSIKDRNGMDLTEAENIKRWQEHTEELYKKDLHNPDQLLVSPLWGIAPCTLRDHPSPVSLHMLQGTLV